MPPILPNLQRRSCNGSATARGVCSVVPLTALQRNKKAFSDLSTNGFHLNILHTTLQRSSLTQAYLKLLVTSTCYN